MPDFESHSRFGLRGRMASNTGQLGAARLAAAAMGAVTLVLAYKGLGDITLFGTLLFIHAYMLFFSEVASFQIWQALIRFGADEVKAKDAPRFASLLRTGVVIDALAAIVAFLLALGGFELFLALQAKFSLIDTSALLPEAQLRPLVTAYCTVILLRQVNVAIGVFRLFDKFSVLALRALVMPGVRLIGVLIAMHLGWGLIGYLAVWYAASALSYLVLQIFAVREIAKRRFWGFVRKARICRPANFPGLYGFFMKTNIDSTLKALTANFPAIAVTLMFGPALFAVYRVAEEVARLLSRGITLFDQVLFPELARMAADLELSALMRTAGRAALGIGIIGLSLAAIVVLLGPTLLSGVLDAEFAASAGLAALLLLASALLGVATPFYSVFYALFRPATAIAVRAVGVISFIGLFFALAGQLGLPAIGWAALIAAGLEVILASLWATGLIRRKKTKAKAPQ